MSIGRDAKRQSPPAVPRLLEDFARLDEALLHRWGIPAICALMAIFFLFASLSLIDSAVALGACCAVIFAAALLLPRAGLLMLMCCVPIQTIFDLPREQMQVYLSFGLLTVAARHVHLVPDYFIRRPISILTAPAALTLVIVAWLIPQIVTSPLSGLFKVIQEAAFFATLVVAGIATYAYAGDRRFRTGLIYAAALSLAVTIVFDVVATYFSGRFDSSVSSALASLRLSGLHVNPNATAKYFILAVMLAYALGWSATAPRLRMAAAVLAVLSMLALSATMSKAGLVAAAGALLVYTLYTAAIRQWRTAFIAFCTLLAFAATAVAWDLWLYPMARDATLRGLNLSTAAPQPAPTPAPGPATAPQPRQTESTLSRISRDYRLNDSYEMRAQPSPQPSMQPSAQSAQKSEMYRNIPGEISYTKRDCGWSCAGQRDRLWSAGFAVLTEHWLIGIGPGRWPAEMQARLGFPFDSPHNAVLEMGGGYGLLGLALYGALVVMLLRLLARAVAAPLRDADRVFAVGASLFLLAILITELFDPAKYLAFSPHGVWLWALAGGLLRLVDVARRQPSPA